MDEIELSREQKTQACLSDPNFMNVLCTHVSNGGTLTDLCETKELRYSDVIKWIEADPERKRQHAVASIAREEWMIDHILTEMKKIAYVDIRQAFNDNGALKDIKDIPADVAAALLSIEIFEVYEKDGRGPKEQVGWTKKIRLVDKLRALEALGAQFDMFIQSKVIVGEVVHQHKVSKEDVDARVNNLKSRIKGALN